MAIGRLQTEQDLKRAVARWFPVLTRRSTPAPRIIRGIIATGGSGTILAGTGFTITRNGTGDVTITFNTAFSRLPAVNLGRIGLGVAHLSGTPTVDSAQVIVRDSSFAAADGSFDFAAVES